MFTAYLKMIKIDRNIWELWQIVYEKYRAFHNVLRDYKHL